LLGLPACAWFHIGAQPPPRPLVIEKDVLSAPERSPCVDWVASPDRSTAGLPSPTTEGELSLIEVRGDDRLATDGTYLAAWSGDSTRVVTLQPSGRSSGSEQAGAWSLVFRSARRPRSRAWRSARMGAFWRWREAVQGALC